MLRVAVILFAATFMAAACGSSGPSEQQAAIDAVIDSNAYIPWLTDVRELGEQDCDIDHGGPGPLDPADYAPFKGRCRWDVVADGASRLVTFSESWPCGIDGTDACTHSWRYHVAADSTVTLAQESGPIAPQLWE